MPVSPEIIHNPSSEDATDLQKIYNGELPEAASRALQGEGFLIAGRFNSRLLGAFVLCPESGHSYTITHLQVRDITRRRGVARQLLLLSLRQLPEAVHQIRADLSEHPELINLFQEAGFTGEAPSGLSWSRPA